MGHSGATPTITNLPDAVRLMHDDAVGTSLITVTATDANLLDTLSFSLAAPPTTKFAIDATTGKYKYQIKT